MSSASELQKKAAQERPIENYSNFHSFSPEFESSNNGDQENVKNKKQPPNHIHRNQGPINGQTDNR